MSQEDPIVIVAAKRTAIGSFAGTLGNVTAVDLGVTAVQAALADAGVKADDVDDVIMGQVLTGGLGQNPARQTAIKAGIPNSKTAMTINQVCGSGLRSVALGMQAILFGDAAVVVAGGQESMSLAPHTIHLRNWHQNGRCQDDRYNDQGRPVGCV